jgi:S-DNA-T family DNA segregation ATPase FtsK/SpoIIIE
VTRRKNRHFVPIDEAPSPGMSQRAREVVALLVIGASLYLLLSLATLWLKDPGIVDAEVPRGGMKNLGGVVGYHLASGCVFLFGFAAYLPFVFGLVYGVHMFVRGAIERLTLKVLAVVVFTAIVGVFLAGPDGLGEASRLAPYGPGGQFGANLSPKLQRVFGSSGRMLVLIFGALGSLLIATEMLLSTLLLRSVSGLGSGWSRLRELRAAPAGVGDADLQQLQDIALASGEETAAVATAPRGRGRRSAPTTPTITAADATEPAAAADAPARPSPPPPATPAPTPERVPPVAAAVEPEPTEASAPEVRKEPAKAKKPLRPVVKLRKPKRPTTPKQQALPFDAAYPFPPFDLFREPVHADDSATQSQIEANAEAIERRLGSFKIGAKVVGVSQGPAVTQYELSIAEGIKVSRIVSFEADLAAALKSLSVRVVAPIPGKDTVGIEVPNGTRQMVVMRELLDQFGRSEDLAIPLYLGKDVAGEPIVEDLARMPHLLIAGTTGSGKSVCINTILLSILMTRSPQQVRLILIDPKMVELQAFKAVPHLSCEVVTNMKKSPAVLEWAVEEMEKRYALFSAVGVNHIKLYNKLGRKEIEDRLQRPIEPGAERMPYQVLVIDELADLMTVAQADVEESIQRLAQKSRAVGLHVILATQRPSTDVITGVIKANLPCQIAFKVNRKIDSRVILDANGAEKLLGHGDMLYVPPSSHQLMRAQGTYVADEEIKRVVEYIAEHGPKPSFLPDLVQTRTAAMKSPKDRDDLYERAVEVILGQQRGSATLLQRALAVGYTRATRLLELMEQDGLVGPFAGAKSREVMMTLDEYKVREASITEELARMAEEGDGDAEAMDPDGDPDEPESDADDVEVDGDGEDDADVDDEADVEPESDDADADDADAADDDVDDDVDDGEGEDDDVEDDDAERRR